MANNREDAVSAEFAEAQLHQAEQMALQPEHRNLGQFALVDEVAVAAIAPDEELGPTDSDLQELEEKEAVGMSVDSVRQYLNQIGKHRILAAEEEVVLMKRIEAGLLAHELLDDDSIIIKSKELQSELMNRSEETASADLQALIADGEQAFREMYESNLKLVVSIAKRYQGRGLPLLDVIQEGNVGLVRAVEKFEYKKGFKFSTYATWWIRQAITRALADQSRTIRIPVHAVERVNKFNRIQREMTQRIGVVPEAEEIAREMGITDPDEITKLKHMVDMARDPISLSTPVGDDGGSRGQAETEFGELIADADEETAHAYVERQALHSELEAVLSKLKERDRRIIELRFGLIDGIPKTLQEVGQVIGLTRERVRQLENAALKRLKDPDHSGSLKTFFKP